MCPHRLVLNGNCGACALETAIQRIRRAGSDDPWPCEACGATHDACQERECCSDCAHLHSDDHAEFAQPGQRR